MSELSTLTWPGDRYHRVLGTHLNKYRLYISIDHT